MEDSPGYQEILSIGVERGIERGRAEGLSQAILDLMGTRLDRIPEGLEERLESLDAETMHKLFTKLLKAKDGSDLLQLLQSS